MKQTKHYKQGVYKPLNESKYKNPIDNYMNKYKYPTYRSSWELKFLKFCDLNGSVLEWSSEPFCIEYLSPKDNKKHRYFPDFIVNINNKIYIIEIKPFDQAYNPKNPSYKINQAKWDSCKKFCIKNNFEFLVLTEKQLF